MNIGEGKEKENKIKTEREANHKSFLAVEDRLRVAGGEEGGGMGNKVIGH